MENNFISRIPYFFVFAGLLYIISFFSFLWWHRLYQLRNFWILFWGHFYQDRDILAHSLIRHTQERRKNRKPKYATFTIIIWMSERTNERKTTTTTTNRDRRATAANRRKKIFFFLHVLTPWWHLKFEYVYRSDDDDALTAFFSSLCTAVWMCVQWIFSLVKPIEMNTQNNKTAN